ncbi:membrane protein insertase YidC [Candidatus Dependentiae bacterium]|nr:membrane protein insertase YidC [Candidatus Dependentiae bacterium]
MDRKLLFAMGLTIATLMIFHYFNTPDHKNKTTVPVDVRPGQSYKVPTAQDLAQPINTEIDFVDKKISQKEEIKKIDTDLYEISFSNYGGVISTVDFKKHLGKKDVPLRTIHHKNFYEREDSAFLLALDEKTPYFYNFKETKELEDSHYITFEAVTSDWIINKIYKVHKKIYKIDLELVFEPKSKEIKSIQPRLFFPAPIVAEISDDKLEGFTMDVSGESVRKVYEKELDQAWVMPSIFGAEDKYFAHCLEKDPNSFVQRAFFKFANKKIYPVLQGPVISQKSSWNISFYVGPKLIDDLTAVDPRLEGLLYFGWLSWLCKLLLKLLEWIYSFLGNFGFAIILLTILIKMPFLPLSITSKKKIDEYQRYQPTINRIRMKYKNDLKLQQAEIMKFHKDHNLSPTTPFFGCLPFLIQMPILFALYRILNGYLDLYQAPFIGWITDLSSKDPYYVLPILMGGSMIWQQLLTPMIDARQKVMMFFLPVIMTYIFTGFPAGLVLYWLMNNLLMISEDYLKKMIYK